MANDERAGLPRPASEEQRREYELDRITARYADEFREGRAPRLEDYVQQYPQYATELADFVLYFHAVSRHLPEPDPVPAPALSSAAQKALARIRQQVTEPAASAATTSEIVSIEGLVKRGKVMGYNARQLAAAVGVSHDLLGKLESKAIAANTIPRTLIRRLAETLSTAPDAVATYLGQSTPAQAGQFFYSEQAPTPRQESFIDAIHGSTLDDAAKREWDGIVAREQQGI